MTRGLRRLEKRVAELEDDGSESNGDGVPFPASKYTPDDFRTGNFDPRDPYTPYSQKQAEQFAALFPEDDEMPEEIRQRSIETAIDRLKNPEDYPAPGEYELIEEDYRVLDELCGGDPPTEASRQ